MSAGEASREGAQVIIATGKRTTDDVNEHIDSRMIDVCRQSVRGVT